MEDAGPSSLVYIGEPGATEDQIGDSPTYARFCRSYLSTVYPRSAFFPAYTRGSRVETTSLLDQHSFRTLISRLQDTFPHQTRYEDLEGLCLGWRYRIQSGCSPVRAAVTKVGFYL